MSGDDRKSAQPRDAFSLKRWSRVKREAARAAERPATAAAAVPVVAPPAESAAAGAARAPTTEPGALPPVDSLTFESDFTGFFGPQVDEGLKRKALKKLFSDPRFNVMDGLDVYIGDYTKPDPLAPDIARTLAYACSILEPPAPPDDAPASVAAAAGGEAPAAQERDASPAAEPRPVHADGGSPASEASEQARESAAGPPPADAPSGPR